MSLVLFGHPFSSYTQKVLIALYENATPFEFRSLGPDQPENGAHWLRLWPLAKFPVLRDEARGETVPESTIIISYLARTRPSAAFLIPGDPDRAMCVFDRQID